MKAGFPPEDIIFDLNVLRDGHRHRASMTNYAVDFFEAVR